MNMEQSGSNEMGSDGLTEEERVLAESWLTEYSEKDIPKEKRVDCEQAVFELQGKLSEFEKTFSLEELHAITDLKIEDARKHPVWEPARKALVSVVDMLNFLKEKTNITGERYAELEVAYQRLSKAVGMISDNKVRHS